jgi:hypothetical protein
MTDDERKASFLHARRHLSDCTSICKHTQPFALLAYNIIDRLAKDEFYDWDNYCKAHGDSMA